METSHSAILSNYLVYEILAEAYVKRSNRIYTSDPEIFSKEILTSPNSRGVLFTEVPFNNMLSNIYSNIVNYNSYPGY